MGIIEKIRKIYTCMIALCILKVGLTTSQFFTKEETIKTETIVGKNPIVSTKLSMAYQEPLTVILQEETKENIEQQEIENRIGPIKKQKEIEINTNIDFLQLDENTKEEMIGEIAEENAIKLSEEILNTILGEYKGFATVGRIEIPKTGIDTPILDQVTVKGMENAPCLLYSTGKLNQDGNHLIVGHNYRNGTIFSDNKNLTVGDKIYVTTQNGERVEYTIYNKFITTAEDVSYIKRDTKGKPEITLSCCTDDDVLRIIILANIEN